MIFKIYFSDDSIHVSWLAVSISKYKYPNSILKQFFLEIVLKYGQKNLQCKSFSFLQKFLQNLENIATYP